MKHTAFQETEKTDQTEGYDENPFIEGLEMPLTRRRVALKGADGPKVLTSVRTGENEGVTELSRIYEVDGDKFIKVFQKHLTVFFDISKNAQKLLEFAMAEAQRNKNKDVLFLHRGDADRYHKMARGVGFSSASYYRAKDELIEKQIIAPTKRVGWFFINLAVFWNGDRATFITEYRKKPEIFAPDETAPYEEIEDPHEGLSMAQIMGEES